MKLTLVLVIAVLCACRSKDTASTSGPGGAATSAGDLAGKPRPTAEIDAPAPYAGELPVRLDLDGGHVMSIGFHEAAEHVGEDLEAGLARLVLRMTGPDAKPLWQRDGFKQIAGVTETPKLLLESCDGYDLGLTKQNWRDGAGVRISVVCRIGDDISTVTELAVLLELSTMGTDPYPPLWSGEGDRSESESDVCSSERTVTFDLSGPDLTITTAQAGPGRGTSCGRPKKTSTKVTVKRRPK